jgi:hypothetical protein
VSLGREAFDTYQPSHLRGGAEAGDGRYTSMVFPVWFEDLKHTIEQQEKEYVVREGGGDNLCACFARTRFAKKKKQTSCRPVLTARGCDAFFNPQDGVKKDRERRCREGLQQGRSEAELTALLKQEAEKDKERDLRLCWTIKPPALLSEEHPVLLPSAAAAAGVPVPAHNPDAPVFSADKVTLCGLAPAHTLFVTAIQLDCYNMHVGIDPKRCHRWSILYRVANDLDAIPIERPLHVDTYTHGICVNATVLSNKLNHFVIVTDRYVELTIHGNVLTLFVEDDGRILIPIEGRAISPLHLLNSSEIHERRLQVASEHAGVEPWAGRTWTNEEPITQRHLLRHLFFVSKAKDMSERVFIAMRPQGEILFHYPLVGFGPASNNEEKDVYIRHQLVRAAPGSAQ